MGHSDLTHYAHHYAHYAHHYAHFCPSAARARLVPGGMPSVGDGCFALSGPDTGR
ncbi:MAG TPA: hypothetical protein PLA90_14900 [Candidatus Sumerlaeota bacterium]|nr:hypothetical protein [Candidatus Sumerlaeota bacterium]